MREEETKERFICNECEKKSGWQLEGSGYPYEKGWTYLYDLSFKLAEEVEGEMPRNKHFCSKECLIKFVNSCMERAFTVLIG